MKLSKKKKSGTFSSSVFRRKIKTTIILNEGEIDFIGGSIQLKEATEKSGIRILSQIPLIANLFKRSSVLKQELELVFFVNPKTLRSVSERKQIVCEVNSMNSKKSDSEKVN